MNSYKKYERSRHAPYGDLVPKLAFFVPVYDIYPDTPVGLSPTGLLGKTILPPSAFHCDLSRMGWKREDRTAPLLGAKRQR